MGRPPCGMRSSTNMFQMNVMSHELAWQFDCGLDDVGLDSRVGACRSFFLGFPVQLSVDKLSLEPLKGLLDLTCRRSSRGHSAYTDRTSDSVCDTVASLRQLKPMQHKQRKLT